MTMETIEVKLNERTLARLRKMAAEQRLSIDAMLQDIIEHLLQEPRVSGGGGPIALRNGAKMVGKADNLKIEKNLA